MHIQNPVVKDLPPAVGPVPGTAGPERAAGGLGGPGSSDVPVLAQGKRG